jgi:hypothetical protein
MDVCGGIRAHLDAGNPCRHDEDPHFYPSLAERNETLLSRCFSTEKPESQDANTSGG